VSVLDPPRADDADVGTAWDQLTTWAGAQRDSLTSQIELRTPQAVAARTAATVTTNQAETELRFARARKAELTEVLTDGPAADTAVAELDQVKTLERQRGEVDKRLLEARAATEARARAMTIEAEE
jgi:hypothetical protein